MELELVNSIPTHLFSLRSKTSEEGESSNVPLILIIPGSPGMGHFYVPFATKLFHLGQGRFDVTVVSQAGHSPGHYKDTAVSSITSTSQQSTSQITDWYTLQDQVTHKLAFIQEKASNRKSLILIGHSIGCWMILNMMHQLPPPPSCISKVFLLFPTIEKMAQSPKGCSFASNLWNSLRIPFTGLVWAASNFTPNIVKSFLLDRIFYTTPSEHLESVTQAIKNIDEKAIYNILKMAKQEMEEVVDPPLDMIDANIDKIVFYYGVGDQWNIESSYRDMAARYPEEVHLCPPNFPHAFVECVSNEMAEIVFSKLHIL